MRRLRHWKRLGVLIGSLLILAQCDNPTAPSIEDFGDFTVSVSAGTRPTYSWSTGPAEVVSVARHPSLVDAWSIVNIESPYIPSPVTHGTVPPGASESFDSGDERTLTKGVKYQVHVSLVDGRNGFKVFTP